MPVLDPDNLRLTDFMDLPTLQEIQDSFAAVANVKATITDASGALITQPTPTKEFLHRQRAIAAAEETAAAAAPEGPTREGREYVAPIIVNNQRLGTIRMASNGSVVAPGIDETKLAALSQKFGVDAKQMKSIVKELTKAKDTRPAAIQFLFLLANAVARLCYQEFQLRQRIEELTAVYNVTMLLADSRDLTKLLNKTTEIVCEIMQTKAASIRLLDQEKNELVTKATYGLSKEYVNKGLVRLNRAGVDQGSVGTQGYDYIRNMSSDARMQYPQEARAEGIASMLSVAMRYKGKLIGLLRVYTAQEQAFSQLKIDLLKAVAAQAAAAIENARLYTEAVEAETLQKQIALAADVQQRMIPQESPKIPGVDLAFAYVPCYTLGGDFFDFIPLPYDNLGMVIADVAGKGVPASLIMASVRAAMRAQVDNLYYLDEVMHRVNLMLYRDTKTSEFVTAFYGVLDTRNNRFTYCNAGHPPGLLLRKGKIIELRGDNMVLGVDPDEKYTQSIVELKSGDMLLLYTDGITDARNFDQQSFGRQRLVDAFQKGGATADIVAQNVLWEMRKFVGMAPRTDDVTMMVARVT